MIVPCYQAERTLRRCIEGLLGQDLPEERFEILLVDNNSTDRTASIAGEYPRVRLSSEVRQGAYAARNRALRQARGDVVAFTDPDCVPRPDWLRELTRPLEEEDVEIVVGRALLNVGSVGLATLQDYETSKDALLLEGDEPRVYFGRTNNMAVRRRVFERLGPFEERARGADTVLVRRCVDHYSCNAVRYQPTAEVLHLEVGDLLTYYRKIATYARSHARLEEQVAVDVIDRSSRLNVVRKACRDHDYALPRSGLLLGLLLIEGLVWRLGRASAGRASSGGP